MRAGQARLGARVAIDVERVFDGVVPGGADGVNEKLTGEFAELESLPHFAAVDRHHAQAQRQFLPPLGQGFAACAEQPEPQRDILGAVARPVIRRDEPRGEIPGVAISALGGSKWRICATARSASKHAANTKSAPDSLSDVTGCAAWPSPMPPIAATSCTKIPPSLMRARS